MYSPYPYPQRTTAAIRSSLAGKVFGLLAFSFAFTAVGGMAGVALGPGVAMLGSIGALVAFIALGFVREKAGWNLGLLYAANFLMGMGIGPIVGIYAAVAPRVLGNALVMTFALVGGLGVYAWRTERDLTKLENLLTPALLGLVLVSFVGMLAQMFIGRMPLFQFVLSIGTAVIFSGFMLSDMQRLREANDDSLPVAIMMAVGLYLNIINIFLALLRILDYLRSDD